jgi:hypothetical protein
MTAPVEDWGNILKYMAGSKMPKLEDAVTYIPSSPNLVFLAGSNIKSFRPLVPFDSILCEFLQDISSELINSPESRKYPDIMGFAFWCRKANINKLKKLFEDGLIRLGLGLVFHITPSNVPVNFAFSFVFGLLAGNANIVRAPSKLFRQVDVISGVIKTLLLNEKYVELNLMNAIVKYSKDDDITEKISSNSNARLIWGGDETIRTIRSFSTPERCVDISFSDRYSFCVIKSESVLELSEMELRQLAEKFYNDSYLMDQNACSSPHLVIWLGESHQIAKDRFWSAVFQVVSKKYDFPHVHAVDKFTILCNNTIDLEHVKKVERHGNYIYRILIEKLPDNLVKFRGKFGLFYEFDAADINKISAIVNKSFQTLTYFGVNKTYLTDFVIQNRLSGIDNITPIGSALDIGVIWDGYDILRSLSRTINVR